MSSPAFHFVGFDISATAVNLYETHDTAKQFVKSGLGLVTAFPHDATAKEEIPLAPEIQAEGGGVDKALLIFVLCALPVPEMVPALKKLRRSFGSNLKATQELYFRDYAACDHNHLRYAERESNTMAEGSFVKGDGTQQFFFDLAFTEDIFVQAGFKVKEIDVKEDDKEDRKQEEEQEGQKKTKTKRLLEYHCNRVVNRANGKQMNKVFVNATFVPI